MRGDISVLLVAIIGLAECQNVCTNKESCNECIKEIGCYWCMDEVLINTTHCYSKDDDITCNNKQSPTSYHDVIINEQLQAKPGKPIVQIRPQKIIVESRKGDTTKVPFQYTQAHNVPIDLYYLMDGSQSMKPQFIKLAALGNNLIDTMEKFTTDFRIGFGIFNEKPTSPYNFDYENKYTFKNKMPLSDGAQFVNQVNQTILEGNADYPEAGFDALMQVMVCESEIGWRNNARRLIVYSSDERIHIAGDGKLAGIVNPNDGKCHLVDGVYSGLDYDYPSISHIQSVVQAGQFNIIFVMANRIEIFKEIKTKISGSEVEELTDDTDVSKLLGTYYEKISSELVLDTYPKNDKVRITYDGAPSDLQTIKVGQVLNFTAEIQATDCVSETIVIQSKGMRESLEIDLEMVCECSCEKSDNAICNNGTLKCGICDCDVGYYGNTCECSKHDGDFNEGKCENEGMVCSNRGNCFCDRCQCHQDPKGIVSGRFCECDDFSCPKHSNEICGGNGKCVCGKCACDANWGGDSCACSKDLKSCLHNGKVCNDHGVCECGVCTCKDGYFGAQCEECIRCSRCQDLKPCVECSLFGKSAHIEDCGACADYNIAHVDSITDVDSDDVKICKTEYENGCVILFKYSYDNLKRLQIAAQETLLCATPINVLALVLGVIGSIILAGIIGLIAWRMATTIRDKKAYAKFRLEAGNSQWSINKNPLFKSPVGTYQNPSYSGK